MDVIIEADGPFGHLAKRDAKRDLDLLQMPHIENILHIEDTTYSEIKETLWRALNKLE